MTRRARVAWAAEILSVALFGCGGANSDHRGPTAMPTPVAPAAGKIGDARLNELLEWARASQNAPAMGAIVIRHGQVAERGVVGLRSAGGAVSAGIDDQWMLGSLTKSMTATLAATQVEDG